MSEKSWIGLLVFLTLISLALSLAVLFTGGYDSYVMRFISGYESPDAQIQVLKKQYAIEKLAIPQEKVATVLSELMGRKHVVIKEQSPTDVGVNDPFKGK